MPRPMGRNAKGKGKGKDGKRHRTFDTKFVCRYPHQIQRQVQLTYALG